MLSRNDDNKDGNCTSNLSVEKGFLQELKNIRSFADAKAFAEDHLNKLKLSVKITLIYATMLIMVLVIISVLTAAGVYISFYHQAQLAMESSIEHTTEKLNRGDPLDISFWAGDPMTQGVVLRVTDVKGGTIIENDPQFPKVSEMLTRGQIKTSFCSKPMNQCFITSESL